LSMEVRLAASFRRRSTGCHIILTDVWSSWSIFSRGL
jgi:hypothetical protein